MKGYAMDKQGIWATGRMKKNLIKLNEKKIISTGGPLMPAPARWARSYQIEYIKKMGNNL